MVEIPANLVGRIVWGNPGKSSVKTDNKTKQPVIRDGQPVVQWTFGVAYPKAGFIANIWPAMNQEAASGYPNGVPPGFAWKMVDGDGIDRQGKPYNQREGYAGCWVLAISTEAFAPNIFRQEGNGYVQVPPENIKTGDFVAVALNIKVNVPKDKSHTPGLYVNPQGVLFVGYGQPIINGPDAQSMFGGQQFQLPPGASATPLMPAGAPGMPGQGAMPGYAPPVSSGPLPGAPQPQPSGYPGAPQPGYQPMPGQPQPGYGAPPAPGYAPPPPQPGYGGPGGYPGAPQPGMPSAPLPPPAHDFVHGAGQPQPGYQPPGMPVTPGYGAPMPTTPGYGAPMPGAPQPGMYPAPGQFPAAQPGYPQPGMPGAPGNFPQR